MTPHISLVRFQYTLLLKNVTKVTENQTNQTRLVNSVKAKSFLILYQSDRQAKDCVDL